MQALSLQPDFSASFIKVKKSKCLPLLAVKPIFNEKARLDVSSVCEGAPAVVTGSMLLRVEGLFLRLSIVLLRPREGR